jgi:hypothetical protein
MVSYEEAIVKPFTDFKKLLIGIVLSLIPIVNFTVVSGYAIESSGVGKTKPSKNMPEWKEWGHLFMKGLGAIVVKIIYMLPAVIVITIGIGLAASDILSTLLGTVLTPEMISQIRAGETTPEQVTMMFRENWYLMLPTIMTVAPLFLLGFVLALIGSFLTPVAVLNYVKNKKLSAALHLGTVVRKALTGQYILSWLAVLSLGILLSIVLSFIPIVGPAIALFVVGIMSYSLYGQVYREV